MLPPVHSAPAALLPMTWMTASWILLAPNLKSLQRYVWVLMMKPSRQGQALKTGLLGQTSVLALPKSLSQVLAGTKLYLVVWRSLNRVLKGTRLCLAVCRSLNQVLAGTKLCLAVWRSLSQVLKGTRLCLAVKFLLFCPLPGLSSLPLPSLTLYSLVTTCSQKLTQLQAPSCSPPLPPLTHISPRTSR